MTEKFTVQLNDFEDLCHNTRVFHFARADGGPVEYEPGQFYRFTLSDEDGEFERSYSLCNEDPSHRGPEVELVVSTVDGGRATRWLWQAEAGATCTIEGPYGRLVVPSKQPERLVLVATSVGIAPFVPMLHTLRSAAMESVLLFGVRNEAEYIYRDLIRDMDRTVPGFSYKTCFSQGMPESPVEGEVSGRVSAHVEALDPDPGRDHFLLCGNPAMVDEVYALLREKGFRPRQVTREKYVYAKAVKAEKKALSDEDKKLIAEKMAAYRKDN